MKKKLLLTILISLVISGHSYANDNILISSGNPDYPPSSWAENNKIVGVAAELTEMIFNDLGIKVESKYFGPWKRVQHNTQKGLIDIITTIYKNPERETYLEFPKYSYMDDKNVIWVPKGKTFLFEKWEDLIGKTGGAVLGDSYGKNFDDFMEEKLIVKRVHEMESNFLRLESGIIDYFPFGQYSGIIAAKRLGYDNKVEYLQTPLLFEGMYLAISKKSKFKKYLPELEEGIKKYKENGKIEKLIKKHLEKYIKSKSE